MTALVSHCHSRIRLTRLIQLLQDFVVKTRFRFEFLLNKMIVNYACDKVEWTRAKIDR